MHAHASSTQEVQLDKKVRLLDCPGIVFANADDPEQDKWYQEMRQHLEADPAWHDGEIIYSSSK